MPKLIYKNKIIASNIKYCDSFVQKGTGLMLKSSSAVEDTAWFFRFQKPRKVGITMFMVFFPIDIIFLDEKNNIVEIVEDVRPFGKYSSRKKIHSFIELKQGTIKKYSVKTEGKLLVSQ